MMLGTMSREEKRGELDKQTYSSHGVHENISIFWEKKYVG
jgi:hypothetical protein